MTNNTIRKSIVRMVHYSKSSHVGTCLSIVEVLSTLYFNVMNIDPGNPQKKDRDKFILSKGHGSAALYATLAERGFFPKEYLDSYYIDNGLLPGHLDMTAVPGIEASAGSLGHGLSIGVGMAVANRINANPGHIYILLGDGECNEGSVWEAVMMAATLRLINITVIIDYNRLQSFGRTNDIINQENMADRWRVFGWEVHEVDGHNEAQLERVFKCGQSGPKAVIAHTIKGKGISYMEDRLEWHYKSPNNVEYILAIDELGDE